MKLYEINAEILRLTDQIDFDPETGEILCDIDAIEAEIHALQMEKRSILAWLAKLVLNTRAEAAAIKTEESRLKSRRERLEKKDARLMSIIDTEGGTSHMDVRRIDKPQTWEELIAIVKEVAATPSICKTLVIDTANWTEQLDTSYISFLPVTVGSVQSLAQPRRLARFPHDYFQNIIVDEAHHCLSNSYKRVLSHFPEANILGVTATPDKGDMKNLG